MKTYNTYQEAKVANPERDIYKDKGGEFGLRSELLRSVGPLDECNPADHCMTVEKFLADGHKFVEGDLILDGGVIWTVSDRVNSDTYIYTVKSSNKPDTDDNERYILRAAALENQMNIDNLATQTPEEKEALDLIDTTPHQYEMSKFSGNEWNGEGLPPVGVECWFNFKVTHPQKCKVNYISDTICVYIGENGNEYSALTNEVTFSKIESPQQREERERLEAAYDLYETRHIDMSAPYHYDEFLKNKFTLDGFLAIVDKTNYRKESN